MQIDPFTQLSQAIDAALEAGMVPALIPLAAAVVTTATVEIRARVRRRHPEHGKKMRTALQAGMKGARGAET